MRKLKIIYYSYLTFVIISLIIIASQLIFTVWIPYWILFFIVFLPIIMIVCIWLVAFLYFFIRFYNNGRIR